MSWTDKLPDRKVLAGGLTGIITFGVSQVAAHYGIPLTPEMQGYISLGAGWLMAYLIPAAEQDVLRHVNDQLIALSKTDPTIPPILKQPKA